MIVLREINWETQKLLKRISNCSKFPQVRSRAKCIMLLDGGCSLSELMKLFGVSRKTLYNWLSRWDAQGLIGLYNQKGRGRKTKLNPEQQQIVKQWVKAHPKSLKRVVSLVKQEWQIEIDKETIKRIIKKLSMTWKRMKRGLSKSPKFWEIEFKMPDLHQLKRQDRQGEIDLRYLDESGFSLLPSIPYAWQEKGTTITLKSSQSQRINVLGLMNRQNQLSYQIYRETITTKTVIEFLDRFSNHISRPTVVVMDQASIHTSDAFIEKLEEWSQKNLKIFWLPPYSPKHNLIEILWKFIKYEWVEVEAYNNWTNLLNYLKKVLDNLGTEYVINFV